MERQGSRALLRQTLLLSYLLKVVELFAKSFF